MVQTHLPHGVPAFQDNNTNRVLITTWLKSENLPSFPEAPEPGAVQKSDLFQCPPLHLSEITSLKVHQLVLQHRATLEPTYNVT